MLYENRTTIPKWLKSDDIADYIVDVEFNLLICQLQHTIFINLLRIMLAHGVDINDRTISMMNKIANKKAKGERL